MSGRGLVLRAILVVAAIAVSCGSADDSPVLELEDGPKTENQVRNEPGVS